MALDPKSCQELLGLANPLSAALCKQLLGVQPYLLLGSVGPDLPAVQDKILGWLPPKRMGDSDVFHEAPRTNALPILGYTKLLSVPGTTAQLAFLLGYIAHMITDCVVHPVVRLAIANGAGTHAEAELVQDSMIFDDITGEEIKDEDYLSWLDQCKTDKATFDAVFSFFADLVKAHPYIGFHDCRTWYDAYRAVFSASRVFPIRCESVTYPRLADISLAKRDQYYLDTKLPAPAGKATGSFKTDVFSRAVLRTAAAWSAIMDRRSDPKSSIDDIVLDWNLNSGELRTTTTRPLDLW
jgi:hypothetical protein